jgi:hypothetical protein
MLRMDRISKIQTLVLTRLCLIILVLHSLPVRAARPVVWNFSNGQHGWKGNHRVADLTVTRDGLSFRSLGIDPWIEGPAVNLPAGRITRVTIRMKSDANSAGELFYGPSFRAGDSVRFVVLNDGQWHDYTVFITDSLGPNTRFRLDPATEPGLIALQSIVVESLHPIPVPPFDMPSDALDQVSSVAQVHSSTACLKHFGRRWGDFRIEGNDRSLAVGYQADILGLFLAAQTEWLHLGQAPVTVTTVDNRLVVRATLRDSQQGTWQIERTVTAGSLPGTLVMTTRCQVDRDRDVILLPWLTLHAGLGSFGTQKDQALLAGLEYLSDEPSSNQADITTDGHLRHIPDPLKICFPLMAVANDGHYLGLIWEPSDWTNALFDSPDRLIGAKAHLMGVTGPAVGASRFENDAVAYDPVPLAANRPLEMTCTVIVGQGNTVVPAVEHYVKLKGLPEIPNPDHDLHSAVTLISHGWLDSEIREGGRFRHALWQGKFKPTHAADAAMFMDWLSTSLSPQDPLGDRLTRIRDLALSEIPMSQAYTSAVSHVRAPSAALRFGKIDFLIRDAQRNATAMLKAYAPDGSLPYRPGETDFSTTHFANHANGYGARNLVTILEAALLSLEPQLIRDALALLDKQTALYENTVPRGAQTWELALHTPDIMASAHLAKAYVLGYVLSKRDEYLQQARYWAWTGVPFVYLINPTNQPVGRYATIPVFGATHWVGSWFGRPVQWCGLVYADALYLLSEYDNQGPWKQLAQGITASGLQQCWTTEDTVRQGLLPDFYYLTSQIPDGPAINPGTLQARLSEYYGMGTLYHFLRVPAANSIIHAPCRITDMIHENGEVQFTLAGWGSMDRTGLYHVLINGIAQRPHVIRYRDKENTASEWQNLPSHKVIYLSDVKALILGCSGAVTFRISR